MFMLKIQFEIVFLEVERMRVHSMNLKSDLEIENHCKFVANYIQCCGWEENEFWEESSKKDEDLDKGSRQSYSNFEN